MTMTGLPEAPDDAISVDPSAVVAPPAALLATQVGMDYGNTSS